MYFYECTTYLTKHEGLDNPFALWIFNIFFRLNLSITSTTLDAGPERMENGALLTGYKLLRQCATCLGAAYL
jgi:hypothetical protein